MFDKVGATGSLLIGFAVFLILLSFSKWWLKSHRQGPLEYIWYTLTWIGSKKSESGILPDSLYIRTIPLFQLPLYPI